MNISVIIPTYNRVALIGRAIDSVRAQNHVSGFESVEIIVVDDGSSDGTGQFIADEFPEVVLLQQTNKGVSAARNLGIQSATADWIALLDSDDEWLPRKLAAQAAVLEQSGLQVCHTQEIWIRNGVRVNQMNKHQKSGGWIYPQCLPLCAMSPSSIIIHRSVLQRVGLFDEDLPACEDYDLWLRICAQHEVAYISEPCINKYGGHEDQLSRAYWGMDRFRVIALEKMLEQNQLSSDMAAATRDILIRKLQILQKGASKHGNTQLLNETASKLEALSAT